MTIKPPYDAYSGGYRPQAARQAHATGHAALSPEAKQLLLTMIDVNYEMALRRNPRLQGTKAQFVDNSLELYDMGLLRIVRRGNAVGLEPAQ
jgi:hypothetical protein